MGNKDPKMTRAEVRSIKGGLLWEVWWKKDILFASTSEASVREMAGLINLGRT